MNVKNPMPNDKCTSMFCNVFIQLLQFQKFYHQTEKKKEKESDESNCNIPSKKVSELSHCYHTWQGYVQEELMRERLCLFSKTEGINLPKWITPAYHKKNMQ